MNPAGPSNEMRFSTDSVPARERLSYFRDAVGRTMLNLDLEPIDERPLRERAIFHAFQNLGVVQADTNGNSGTRTRALLADSNDDLILMTVLSGCGLPALLGRELTLRAGAATMRGEW